MTKYATLALVVAATVMASPGMASPVMASPVMASPVMAQTGGTSPSVAAASPKAKAAPRHARPLYNMAPGSAPANGRDDPAFTGGGSLGYNQMIYNW